MSESVFQAAARGDVRMLRLLIRKGHMDDADDEGNTPLMIATRCNRPQAVAILLERQANVNHVNAHGDGALHIAAQKGNLEGELRGTAPVADVACRTPRDHACIDYSHADRSGRERHLAERGQGVARVADSEEHEAGPASDDSAPAGEAPRRQSPTSKGLAGTCRS